MIRAAASGYEPLRAAAVACCAWWRRTNALPADAWQILEALGPIATSGVAESIAEFVSLNEIQASIRDWHLLASVPFAPNEIGLAARIGKIAADLVAHSKLKPDADSVERFLRRFELLSDPQGRQIEHAFAKLAEAFPVERFLMLWRRNQARKAGNISLKPLPYDFTNIGFSRIMESAEVKTLVARSEERLDSEGGLDFDEMRLLRSAIQQGSDNPSAWLEAAALRAATTEKLTALCELGSVGGNGNIALAFPDFARSLLNRARAIGGDCHTVIFSRLLSVGGVRGFTNGEPDGAWKGLLETIERRAESYVSDIELGPLFSEILRSERSWMSRERHPSDFDEDV